MPHSPRVDDSESESSSSDFGGAFVAAPYIDSAVRVSSLKVSQEMMPVTDNETTIDWYSEAGLLIQVRGGEGELRYLAFETEFKYAFMNEGIKPEKIPMPMCIPMINETEGFVYLVRGGISKWRRCLKVAVATFRRMHFTVVEVTVISIGVNPHVTVFNRKGVEVSNGRLLEKLQSTVERMRRHGEISNSRYVTERPMKKGAHRMHVFSPDIPSRSGVPQSHAEVINRPAPAEPKNIKQLKSRAQRNAKLRSNPVKRPAKRVRT